MNISDYFGFFNYCMYFNGPTILRWFCHHILPKKRYAWTTNPHSYGNFDFRQYLQHMYLCALIRLSAVSLCTDNLTQPLFFQKKLQNSFRYCYLVIILDYMYVYICMYIYAYKYIEECRSICTCMHIYMCISIYIFLGIWIRIYTNMNVHCIWT